MFLLLSPLFLSSVPSNYTATARNLWQMLDTRLMTPRSSALATTYLCWKLRPLLETFATAKKQMKSRNWSCCLSNLDLTQQLYENTGISRKNPWKPPSAHHFLLLEILLQKLNRDRNVWNWNPPVWAIIKNHQFFWTPYSYWILNDDSAGSKLY